MADGVFAPSFLFFLDLVARMWAVTAIPIHVRLMVADAVLLSQVAQFAEAEADLISLHVENAAVAADASDLIEGAGLKAGMVLWVETSVATVMPLLGRFDFLTQLGTAIGVKGQGLDPAATARLIEAAGLIKAGDRRVVLAADGGKRDTTVPPLRAAGAETMVMGSLAFGAADLGEWMRWLHGL